MGWTHARGLSTGVAWVALFVCVSSALFAEEKEALALEEIFGKYPVTWVQDTRFLPMPMTTTTKDAKKDGDLGLIELSEKKLVCPIGTFEVLAVRKDPGGLGWNLKLDSKPKALSCFVMWRGRDRVGVMVSCEEFQISYAVNRSEKVKEGAK
jgi:hypothetical protein